MSLVSVWLHLVAMAVNLQIIQDLIEADPREAGALVSEVRSEVAEALGTLRDLARGLNERCIPTSRGGEWSAMQVKRLLSRLDPSQLGR